MDKGRHVQRAEYGLKIQAFLKKAEEPSKVDALVARLEAL
jgi:hypothetical protein